MEKKKATVTPAPVTTRPPRATSVPRRRESRYQIARCRRGVRPRRRPRCLQSNRYQMEGHARQPTRRGGSDRERGRGGCLPSYTDVTLAAAAAAAAFTAAASTMTTAAAAGPPRSSPSYPSTVNIGSVVGRRGGESAREGGSCHPAGASPPRAKRHGGHEKRVFLAQFSLKTCQVAVMRSTLTVG